MAIPPFAHIAAVSYFLPAGVGLRYWKLSPAPMKVFTLFCVYSTLHLIAEFTLGRMKISNQFLLNYHQIIELGAILYVYHAWVPGKRLKDLFQYFGLGYSLLWIVNKFFFEDPMRFSENISLVALFLQIIASLIIMNSIVNSSREHVSAHAIFWIALGVLLYASGTIIVNGFSNTILAMGMVYFNILWHINWGFTIIANILYARSFRCRLF